MSKPNHRSTVTAFFLILIFASAILFSNTSLEKTKIHADEPGWIASGYIHTELLANLIKGNFDLKPWQARDSYFNMNGQIGKWMLGIPVWTYFHTARPQNIITPPNLTISSFSALTHSLWQGVREGNIETKDIIVRSRKISAFFAVLCTLLVFAIGCMCGNVLLGTIAAVLLLMNHLFLASAARAMTDIYYLFFLLCCCFFVTSHTKRCGDKNGTPSARLSILWGIFSGLATSVKITGILVGSFYFLIYTLFEKVFLKRTKFWMPLITFFFSTIFAIYLFNPAFWIPVSEIKMGALFKESKAFSQKLLEKLKGKDIPIELNQYPQLTRLGSFPLVFPEWNYVMREQQENISKGIWRLNPQEFGMTIDDQVLKSGASKFLKINKLFFYLHSPFPFVQILFLFLGIVFCVIDLKKKASQNQISIYVGPFFFFLANYIFILFTLKLNWDRYFLTSVVVAQIITAIGIIELCKQIISIK